jgi:hypothetical protein
MVDFDDIEDWAPMLTRAFARRVPKSTRLKLAATKTKYLDTSPELLFKLTDRDTVIDATIAWISSTEIAGYHGSRLTDAEVASVQTLGLLPLKAETRRSRLLRALASHPRWHQVADQLDEIIRAHGPGSAAGGREGQVHLTLSRTGLTNGFNHYLKYGSEFDQRVAHALLGAEGKELLASDGQPRVIQFAVPGPEALNAAHPHFSIDSMRDKGEVPNLIREYLETWSYRLAHPEFQTRKLKTDCGMVFRSPLPIPWIKRIDRVAS